ncbi:MAG: hypothetical protein NZ898_06920, partial [Myxococcota bacterium]|nr:hypothetical protein [Myxococcota bacterium]
MRAPAATPWRRRVGRPRPVTAPWISQCVEGILGSMHVAFVVLSFAPTLGGVSLGRAQYADWEAAEAQPAEGEVTEGDALPPARLEARPAAEDERPERTTPASSDEGDFLRLSDALAGEGGRIVTALELASYVGPHDAGGAVRATVVAVSAVGTIAYAPSRRVRLGAQLPVASAWLASAELVADGRDVSGLGAVVGNPVVMADLLAPASASALRWRVGLGAALPVAPRSTLRHAVALGLGAATRGAWNLWHWAGGPRAPGGGAPRRHRPGPAPRGGGGAAPPRGGGP